MRSENKKRISQYNRKYIITLVAMVCCLLGIGFSIGAFSYRVYSVSKERQEAYMRWNLVINEISNYVADYPYSAGVVIRDLTNNFSYCYQGDKRFISASLIKLPIMCSVFQKMHEGALSLTDTLVLNNSQRVSGSGSLRFKGAGSRYTVEELLCAMIADSDNTAAKMLTDYIGLEEMNASFKKMGLRDTNISRNSFCMSRRKVKEESYITPYDISHLLEKIYDGSFINSDISTKIVDILKLTKDNSRLSRYLPDQFELAHKTGLLRGACHDAGIVFTPRGAYLICVLTEKNRSYYTAKRFIAGIGKLAYQQI